MKTMDKKPLKTKPAKSHAGGRQRSNDAPEHGKNRQAQNKTAPDPAILTECAALLEEVLRFEYPFDAVLSRYFREHRHLGQRQRATLATTAYRVVQQKNRFDHLARLSPKGLGSRFRRLALLAFAGDAAFLQNHLSEAEKEWLSACASLPESHYTENHKHNLPEWLAQRIAEEVPDAAFFTALCASLQTEANMDIRVNSLLAKRETVLAELQALGLAAQPTPYAPLGIRLAGRPAIQRTAPFENGSIEVQDEGSQILATLLDAKRGEMVVDFCAGAGGKTLALGAQMRNTGRLYAMDVSAHRLQALKPRLARSGLSNVHPLVIAHERDERIKRLYGKIDRVLVDAPCSGLGTLRRNPDMKWRHNPQTLSELQAKQTAILNSAAKLLKTGGRLVYATCSLLRAENEEVADAFSAENPNFRLLPVSDILKNMDDQGDYLRLWPHLHQCDGFFAAVWEKI